MKIGVFDSGVGGKSVADSISRTLPEIEVLFRADNPAHFPYATKSPDELFDYVVPVIQTLIDDGCEVVVIACNTVSTTLIGRLRQYFAVPFVAIEPMIKPAALLTMSNVITVCATPTTLASARYAELKQQFASWVTVLEPDCSDWSSLIERNHMTEERIRARIEPGLARGSDVIVLGCTHYHWIEGEIRNIVGLKTHVLQPEQAVITQLTRVLAQLS